MDGLEKELAAYTGAKHAIGCTSGTDAILLGLWALGVGPGDEVITSPYTFFATVGSTARLGAHCRFVDIDPATYNLDIAKVEKAITKKTKAIMPVHLYGQCVDMQTLNALAAKLSVDNGSYLGLFTRAAGNWPTVEHATIREDLFRRVSVGTPVTIVGTDGSAGSLGTLLVRQQQAAATGAGAR